MRIACASLTRVASAPTVHASMAVYALLYTPGLQLYGLRSFHLGPI